MRVWCAPYRELECSLDSWSCNMANESLYSRVWALVVMHYHLKLVLAGVDEMREKETDQKVVLHWHSERMKRPLMATRIASISVRELWPQIVKRQILISTNQLHRYYYHWIVRDIPDREKERTLGSVPDDSRGNSEFHPTRPFHSLPRPLVPRRSSAPAYQLKLLWTACCGIHKEMMFLEELIILGTTAVHKSFSWITLKLSYSSEHIRNTYPSILQYHHNPRPFLLNCSIRSHYFKYSLLLRG